MTFSKASFASLAPASGVDGGLLSVDGLGGVFNCSSEGADISQNQSKDTATKSRKRSSHTNFSQKDGIMMKAGNDGYLHVEFNLAGSEGFGSRNRRFGDMWRRTRGQWFLNPGTVEAPSPVEGAVKIKQSMATNHDYVFVGAEEMCSAWSIQRCAS